MIIGLHSSPFVSDVSTDSFLVFGEGDPSRRVLLSGYIFLAYAIQEVFSTAHETAVGKSSHTIICSM